MTDNAVRKAVASLARVVMRQALDTNAYLTNDEYHDLACLMKDDFSDFEEESDPAVPVLDLAEDKPVRVRVCGVEFDCYLTGFTRNVMARVGGDPLYHVEMDLEADMVSFPRNFPEG